MGSTFPNPFQYQCNQSDLIYDASQNDIVRKTIQKKNPHAPIVVDESGKSPLLHFPTDILVSDRSTSDTKSTNDQNL